jgi:hypothetical protein
MMLIFIAGRFLKEFTADDVVFGNTFDKVRFQFFSFFTCLYNVLNALIFQPIRDSLPWGMNAALHVAQYIDPPRQLPERISSELPTWLTF